jgi:hypothetical protein
LRFQAEGVFSAPVQEGIKAVGEPANKITHCNVEIKRRTISLTGILETT